MFDHERLSIPVGSESMSAVFPVALMGTRMGMMMQHATPKIHSSMRMNLRKKYESRPPLSTTSSMSYLTVAVSQSMRPDPGDTTRSSGGTRYVLGS